jgi:hypothetical protein
MLQRLSGSYIWSSIYLEHADSSSRKTPVHFLLLAVTYASKKKERKKKKGWGIQHRVKIILYWTDS